MLPEEGIKLIIKTLDDKARKVRQTSLLLLIESETKIAKQALWNYSLFSKMQESNTITEFNLRDYDFRNYQPSYLAISNHNNTLICHWRCSPYYFINAWELTTGILKKSCLLQYAEICRLGKNGEDILCSFDDFISRISIEELEDFGDQTIMADPDMGSNSCAFAVAFSLPLVSGGSNFGGFRGGTLKIRDYINSDYYLDYSFNGLRLSNHHINTGNLWQTNTSSLFFTPDDKILIAHFVPNRLYSNLKLWNVQTGKLIQTIENLPKLTITSVGVCPDGTIIACGIREEKICTWELQKDKIIFTTDEMCPCILSENGRVLIYATANNEIVIRDLVKQQELCRLIGHNAPIAYLTLSTDYEFIASYSIDRQIKIWGIPEHS